MMTKLYQLCATLLWVPTIVIWQPVLCHGTSAFTERQAADYLEHANEAMAAWTNRVVLADWNWLTNLTSENAEKKLAMNGEFGKYLKVLHKETLKFPWTTYKDPDIRRQFKLFSVLGTAALPEEKLKKFDETVSAMENIYGTATIPDLANRHSNRTLSLDPDLTDILAMSFDVDDLQHVWTHWRDATGKKVKHMYTDYVKLSNEAARLNNYTDTADFWIRGYEVNDFRERMEHLWKQIKPLYLQIHAYARKKLWERYGEDVISRKGPIPAHLLGDMWAQSWERLYDFSLPFPRVQDIDPTKVMMSQNYSPKKMFKLAEEFFTSVNLSAMPHSFWEKSILEKPRDRDILCHASAWDFFDSKDYRIKQCTSVNFVDFLTAHHEMGHIQYFLQYKDQPYIYRDGANEGFHEAIGDTIALSVSTPKHLHKIGLLPKTSRSPEADINYLYKIGLDKIAFLPFGYLMDLWRWNVFEGKTTKDHYNCDWWDLRYNYQGIEPPVVRSENDFDPGSKYHIVGNVPYIRYFVSFIIQFQFHQALCEKAGEFDPNNPKSKPLHECDIYQSTNAGNAFKDMLKLGSSKPWFDAMELLTGQREMDARPLLNYFRPLQEWLENENRKTGELIGWESTKTMCTRAAGARSDRRVQG